MKKLLLVLALLLAVGTAFADQVTVNFLGYNGGQWQNGYPYYANINGGQQINVMCDDWFHGGEPGQHWQANVSNLGGGNSSTWRFNLLPDYLTLYREVGWLLIETQVTPQNQWGYMNYAAWHIFDSQAPLDQNSLYWYDQALQEAKNGFKGVDFTQVEILTPVNQYDPDPNGPQELLTLVPSSAPEPGTLALLGTGLVGLWGWGRKKFLS